MMKPRPMVRIDARRRLTAIGVWCIVACAAALFTCGDVWAAPAAAWAGGAVGSIDVGGLAKESVKKAAPEEMPVKTPTEAIKDLDAMLDDFKAGTDLSPKDEAHNSELKMKIIHGTFDVRELSRLSLAKHWEPLTPEQRQRFVDLMVSLLEEKALFSKEQSAAKSKQGGKYKVIYRGHRFLDKDRKQSFVRTKVVIPAERIEIDLNYKLKRADGEWKIFDVIVDEASLVHNYRYQFNSIITKHSYDELIDRMSRKLDEIKGERREKDEKKS